MFVSSIVFVVKTNASPNTDEELARERIYRRLWVAFFILAFVVIGYAFWGPGTSFNSYDFVAGIAFVMCLSLFTLWSVVCFVRIFCARNEGAENARSYARQMLWYNVVFIVLVFPELVYATVAFMKHNDTTSIHLSLQLALFLQQVIQCTPF
jgi:hypothetical protein